MSAKDFFLFFFYTHNKKNKNVLKTCFRYSPKQIKKKHTQPKQIKNNGFTQYK